MIDDLNNKKYDICPECKRQIPSQIAPFCSDCGLYFSKNKKKDIFTLFDDIKNIESCFSIPDKLKSKLIFTELHTRNFEHKQFTKLSDLVFYLCSFYIEEMNIKNTGRKIQRLIISDDLKKKLVKVSKSLSYKFSSVIPREEEIIEELCKFYFSNIKE